MARTFWNRDKIQFGPQDDGGGTEQLWDVDEIRFLERLVVPICVCTYIHGIQGCSCELCAKRKYGFVSSDALKSRLFFSAILAWSSFSKSMLPIEHDRCNKKKKDW